MPRNRSLPPHLEIRRNGYYWRRRLPRSLRDRGGASRDDPEETNCTPSKKSFLCFSLRTHVPANAKILARRLTEMSDLVFAADAEMIMAIAPETQVWMLESLARFEIEAFERARAVAGPRSAEEAALGLRREEALQATLRQALHLGNREVARHPLRHVAGQLGIEIDEADEDWAALAYEATKVLLDVSLERARRQQGHYDQPTVFFRRAVSTASAPAVPQLDTPAQSAIAPAAFATSVAVPATPMSAHVMPASNMPDAGVAFATLPDPIPETPETQSEASSSRPSACTSTFLNSTLLTQIVVPDGFDRPEGYTDESWQAARIAARPPRILIDQKLLSEASRAALKKKRGITVPEAIELYFELVSLGYRPPFTDYQKRQKVTKPNAETTEERLPENYVGKYRLARAFWPACFGDDPIDEITVDDVNDALNLLWGVPANHGRSERDRGEYTLIELIERADAEEARLERDIEAAKARGATAEEIDKMRLVNTKPRISVTTYINHGRVLGNVGKMLMDMQLIDRNPFAICCWTNDEEKKLKKREGGRKRQAWDDRIYKLLGSRIFQEPLEDIGEPLFWAPLIARHQGMRMEEILQLGPDDFGTDKGIPTLTIQHTIVNGVKTLSSARTLPVHPQLVELGLLKLVELRKKACHIRLFPFLNRGKQKGTFSANFSKTFAYYRKTNECYWPGLDFHALRTTFHHDLLGDDKSDAIRCRLMGHTRTDEGDQSYGQNLKTEKLARRLESVVVDVSKVRRPFEDPSAAVKARAQEHGLRVVA